MLEVSRLADRFQQLFLAAPGRRGIKKSAAIESVNNSTAAAGSGTAADSGSAEGIAEPLPGPREVPKLARQMS